MNQKDDFLAKVLNSKRCVLNLRFKITKQAGTNQSQGGSHCIVHIIR